MSEPHYRTLILQRLRERDRKCAPFARVFASYDALTDTLHHMAAKQKLRQRNRSTAEDTASGEEVEALRQELAEVYKKKAINDQQLIDTNNKLTVVEKDLKKVTKERDDALKRMKEMEKEVERARNTAGDTLADNQLIKDELLALHTMYDALNKKYLVCDEERNQLIDRLKEMKEHEVAVINEFNEKEHERQRQRLCAAIEEAAKPNPVMDAKAPPEPSSNPALKESFEMIGLDGALGSVDFGVEHFDDIIPERCTLKFECDEMGEVNDCLWHPNGKMLFTAGSDKKIHLFEFANETCTKKSMFTGANQGITRIDADPECKHILGSSNDYAVRIWSIADQRQRHAFTGHTDKVTAAKFHAQGRQVVSGSHDRTIKIFDIGANRCQKTLMPGSTVFDVASNDRFGIPIISGHFDKNIRFWDTRCDTHTNAVKMNGKVTSLNVSSDGQYLLCSSRDETLSLIDLRNYGIVHIYSAEQYRTSSDYSKCIISPGMKFVAAGSAEGHVFIWNLNTTKLEKVLYKGGHEGHAVLSISWHPSGHMLLTGDRRKTACVWR